MQYCLSVLQDSNTRSCKHNFSSSHINKSPVDLSRGCGNAAIWWNSNAHWKIRVGNSVVFVDAWERALSCWNQLLRSDFSCWDNNCSIISWYTSPVIVDVKKIGPAILFLDIPHQIHIFLECRLDPRYSCRFSFDHTVYGSAKLHKPNRIFACQNIGVG